MEQTLEANAMGARARGAASHERWALRAVLVLTLAGVGVAGYLVKLHADITGNPRGGFCTFTDTISCDKVLASPYARIAGIPVALIGLLGFALLFSIALWRVIGQDRTPNWLPLALMLTAGFGLAFELAMTWVEFFVIEAVCPYCLTAVAFIAGTFLAAVAAWRGAATVNSGEVRNV